MPALDRRVPVTARGVRRDNDPIVPAHAAAQLHSTPEGATEHPQADGWVARRLFGCAAPPTAPTLLRVQVRRQWILPSQGIATPDPPDPLRSTGTGRRPTADRRSRRFTSPPPTPISEPPLRPP
jgi:hypothetical protein